MEDEPLVAMNLCKSLGVARQLDAGEPKPRALGPWSQWRLRRARPYDGCRESTTPRVSSPSCEGRSVNKAWTFLKHEFHEILPPMIFFFIS